jgi:hypothetical protein
MAELVSDPTGAGPVCLTSLMHLVPIGTRKEVAGKHRVNITGGKWPESLAGSSDRLLRPAPRGSPLDLVTAPYKPPASCR